MINFYCTKVRPVIKRLGRAAGIKPNRSRRGKNPPPDFDEQTARIFRAVHEYTMTSPERIRALVDAVRYVVADNVAGAIVECGVWRGGSMMAVAIALRELGVDNRDLYLYDTFEGMSAPTEEDGDVANKKFAHRRLSADSSDWCRTTIEEVKKNLTGTGYPMERIHFIKGKVEDTLPEQAPAGPIAILRLDTDWYESTRQEMDHLYPMLEQSGVLILDDYGSWQGARKAVDEYLAEHDICLPLNRIDSSARMSIKQSPAARAETATGT